MVLDGIGAGHWKDVLTGVPMELATKMGQIFIFNTHRAGQWNRINSDQRTYGVVHRKGAHYYSCLRLGVTGITFPKETTNDIGEW